MRGCRTTRSPARPVWRVARSARRWRERAGGWWKPMTQEARGNMSHVDDGTLHAYLDGELAPVERARFEAHVAECAACRGRLEEERALIERASNLLALAQPPDRSAPPLHELRRPRLAWRLRVPLAWAATVVLALGIGYYVGDQSVARAPEVYGLVGDSPASNAGAADSANNALARRENTRDGFATAERRRVVAPPQQTPPRAAETQKQ